MSGSTWTWVGGTINVDSPTDWTLTSGPGNPAGIPETGDTAINNGTLAGFGLIAATLVNNGTVEATNNSVPGSSTGGDLHIQGAVSGTGSMTIEPSATLQIDGALGTGQAIVYSPGGPETLILGAPAGTIANAIGGFAAGDRIEFANGITLNSNFALVPAGTTLTVGYHNAGGTGTYVFTNVAFSGDGPVAYLPQSDFATGNADLTLTTFMNWVGANGANFSAPSSWNFGTIVPSAQNFVTFNNSAGGTIGGTGTVQGFNFNNGGIWSLASGAKLVSVANLNIGNPGGTTNSVGNLVIGPGSTIFSSGFVGVGGNAGNVSALTLTGGGVLDETAPGGPSPAMQVANAASSGTLAAASASVLVTGAGSFLNLGANALYIANNGGNGTVTVSQGGSIFASSFNDNTLDPLSIGYHGNGTLIVTDPGSQLTANGVAYLAHVGTGTLVVENSGSVLIAPDPVGLVGLIDGDGNQNGVGGSAIVTVTTNGVLDDQGYMQVGLRGTQGQLSVNHGTVQVGTTLYVGDGGTIPTAGSIALGTTETASGTLTIGAGGTVELTGAPQTASYGVYLSTSNQGAATPENAVATVSGVGALLDTNGNGLAVAQDGTASLTVSQGGSVISGTANSNLISALAIGRQGNGTVTVTDPGSQMTANGVLYVGRGGTSSLIVENQGSVVIGLDGTNTGNLAIGGEGTSTGGTLFMGGIGTAQITSGGAATSQSNINVGLDGSTGFLNLIGGTAVADGLLHIGDSVTLSPGATLISPIGTTSVTTTTVESGTGVVTVGAGGLLQANGAGITSSGTASVVVGDGVGATGTLNVSGAGATVNAGGYRMSIGGAGQGTVLVSQGGSVTAGTKFASDAAIGIGVSASVSGALTVTGLGSSVVAVGQITVGQAGTGSLTIENAGTVRSGNSTLAPDQGIAAGTTAGGTGTITVTGAQSLLTNTGQFIVGGSGLGRLSIQSGGTVLTTPGSDANIAGMVIANAAGGTDSSVEVSGTGSTLNVTGLLDVGASGSGELTLGDGASVTAGSLDAGNVASAVGQISLSGAGTELTVAGAATVADDGTGVMSVLSGATFAATSLTIGSQGDSSGALVVSGDGSLVQLSGALNIGTALGIGDLTVGPGAAVNAQVVSLQGQVVLEGGLLDPTVQLINQGQTAGGFGTIAAGDIVDEGVIQAGGNKASQKLLLVQGTILGGGTLTVNGTQPGSNPVGVLQINAGGTMELTGPVINAATTTFTDNLTPTGTYTVNNSVVDVTFADAAGVLKLDDIAGFAGTISTHQAGDSFVITGGTLSNPSVVNGNTLTFADSGAGGIDSIIFASQIDAAGFNIVNGNTVQIACFAEGSRIETETGLVAVESLRAGGQVVTADGVREPIVWIGQRAVNCERHPRPETVWPVRVSAGAFGQNVPVRDLYLSPDHAVFVNNVLIPVRLLINGTSIARVKQDRVRYFHVELPRHAVILAEGLTVESYLDTGDRKNFSGGTVTALHPDFVARTWEMAGCAKFVTTGKELAAARRKISIRARRWASQHERSMSPSA